MAGIRLVCVTLLVLFLTLEIACAANIRGRIDGYNQYSPAPYPLAGVVVEIFYQNSNGWQLAGRYVTGIDGMYYLPGLMEGAYVLQINKRENYPVNVLNQPYQDLPPIVIRY